MRRLMPERLRVQVIGLSRRGVLILDGLVVLVRDQRVAANGDNESWHYSHAPRTEERRAMRMMTPL